MNTIFTLDYLTTLFNKYQGMMQQTTFIKEVITDSRKQMNGALFVPIVGENFDGHEFVAQAANNGAIATLWDESKPLPLGLDDRLTVFFVEDTVIGLQYLATAYRSQVDPTVIGITGSNGKTTTKDIVAAILKEKYKTHSTLGNLNNQIGLPLTILSMEKDTEMLVLEMGMNHFNEIDLLSRIAQPDYAIITNIGESHIEFLGSRAGIAKAKLEITHGLKEEGTLIIDGDEDLLKEIHTNHPIVTCGFELHNQVVIQNPQVKRDSTFFQLADNETYEIPLLGKHHAKNAVYGITLAKKLKVDPHDVKRALLGLDHTSMRFERTIGAGGVSIINDAYNASPTSMKAAIEVVKEMSGYTEKILVLGDIFELGKQSKSMHTAISESIVRPISVVFTIGNDIKATNHAITEENIYAKHFDTKEALLDALKPYLHESSLILFKASRGMHFEEMIQEIKK